jgi:hypothetical protein
VEFRTVTASLNRQILQSYLQLSGKAAQLGPFGQLLIGAASTQVDQAIEGMSGPKQLVEIMTADRTSASGPDNAPRLLPRNLRDAWSLYSNSEYSFDDFYVTVPPSQAEAESFRIRLRLIRWTWKLHEIQLPDELRARLARRIMSATESK